MKEIQQPFRPSCGRGGVVRRALALVALLAVGFHSHIWEDTGYVREVRPDGECPTCEEERWCQDLRCDCGAHRHVNCSDWERALQTAP